MANANYAAELAYEAQLRWGHPVCSKINALDPDRAEAYVTLAKALDRVGATGRHAVQAFRDGFYAEPGTLELLRGYLVALIHEGDLQAP